MNGSSHLSLKFQARHWWAATNWWYLWKLPWYKKILSLFLLTYKWPWYQAKLCKISSAYFWLEQWTLKTKVEVCMLNFIKFQTKTFIPILKYTFDLSRPKRSKTWNSNSSNCPAWLNKQFFFIQFKSKLSLVIVIRNIVAFIFNLVTSRLIYW